MSEQQTGFIKFRRVNSVSETPDQRTLYLINKYSGPEEDAVITHIDLQFGGFSVGRMDYTTELNSDNDVRLEFTYNDTSKGLEVKANLNRKNDVTNLLKIDGTSWYVDTADVKTIIDSYIVAAFPTTVTDETVPSTKLVKTSLDNKEDLSNKVITVRASASATDEAYPTEKAVRTELDNRVIKNANIEGATKPKITYDSKGLVTSGADLVATDIPELPQSKITNLGTDLDNKVTKNENIVGATKPKITYDAKGLVTKGEDLAVSDIPELPQTKIANLGTDLDSKVSKNENIVGATKPKITYDSKGLVTGGADLVVADIPELPQSKITNLGTALSGKANSVHTHEIVDITDLQDSLEAKESVANKVTTVRVDGTATDENYPSEKAVRTAINTAVQGLPVGGHTHVISDVEGLQASLNSKEVSDNKVASWGTTPTDTKYPSEKLVKDSLDTKESVANKVTSWGATPTNTKYPSEKLVKDSLDTKVNIEVGKGLSTKDYTAAEQTKLAGIAEGAEVNVQSDWSQTDTTADDFIKNKPTLATVAISGDFDDLINIPLGIDPSEFEKLTNKVTSIRNTTDATDAAYPTEKAVRAELDTKANSTHLHVITDVTNLESTLALKENEANKVVTIRASANATDVAYPTEKAVRTELDLREVLVNKRTAIRASGTATDVAYPTEKAVRTALDTKVDTSSIYTSTDKTLPTDLPSDASSSDSLVMSQKASILSFSKRGHTHAEFDTKENIANKVTTIRASANATDTNYPTEKAVRTELDNKENTVNRVTTIRASASATDTNYPTEKAVRTELGNKLDNGYLINTYTNNATINVAQLNNYKFLLFEVKKLNGSYNGTFYGDSVMSTPSAFFYINNSYVRNIWIPLETSPSYDIDLIFTYNTSEDFIGYLNSSYPAGNRGVGDIARAKSPLDGGYWYAMVEEENVPLINRGGIRLQQFNGSTLTYATVASISATQVRINCDTTYNVSVWGFK